MPYDSMQNNTDAPGTPTDLHIPHAAGSDCVSVTRPYPAPGADSNSQTGQVIFEEGLDTRYCRPERLHHLFEMQVSTGSDRTAIVDGTRILTYQEVEDAANRLARYLRARDLGQGDFIAVLLERSAEVYISLLAILKAGAAYVPLDPEYPAARISDMIEDCAASALLSSSRVIARQGSLRVQTILLDQAMDGIACLPHTRMEPSERDAGWRDPCYVIYTSGSTGRPKGVLIEHRSACNYVRASAAIYRTTPADRVFQGFSIAFDFAVEEVWMAFGAGAALVVGTLDALRSGPALSKLLTDLKITALSCVPTLLATMEDDVPTLTLLNVGGEQCPQDLVTRWWKPGRRLLNTYGPTEATVTATWSELRIGKPVTIGVPLPNYRAWILDEDMRKVGPGEEGELYLSGAGLARGYLHRIDLTRERFVPNPFAVEAGHCTLYKTGDLASWNEDGEILFHGRIDAQVKFRGFRIELTEIETVLLSHKGVASAVAALRDRAPGVQALAGYIVPKHGAALDLDQIKEHLRAALPYYMVPGTLDIIESIPVMTSGKVERNRLPEPAAFSAAAAQEEMNALETLLAQNWKAVFKQESISLDADFFLDLGGHSLLAAFSVSDLRKQPGMSGIAVSDIYAAPTLRALAARLERRYAAEQTPREAEVLPGGTPYSKAVPSGNVVLCGIAQAVLLFFIFGLVAAELTLPVRFAEMAWQATGALRTRDVLIVVCLMTLMFPANMLLTVAAKWLVIGRYRAGEHPLWGSYYLRWWFVRRLQMIFPVRYLTGAPLINLYFRALGAKVGAGVHLGTTHLQSFDLIEIEADASIGFDTYLNGHHVEAGVLKIGSIHIGRGACVGNNSVISPNCRIGAGGVLGDKSMLPGGASIPSGETWSGSPANPTAGTSAECAPGVSKTRRMVYAAVFALLSLILPLVPAAAMTPGILVGIACFLRFGFPGAFLSLFAAAPLFVLTLCLLLAGLKALFVGSIRPGKYPLHSAAYVRRWLLDRLMMFSLDTTNSLYATVYLTPWLKLLGARIGRHSEISTAAHITPDLLTFGDAAFIADGACLGAPVIRDGWIHVDATRIGDRSFIGNSALVPSGTTIPNDCLVGCLSVPPESERAFASGTSWLGLPAMFLPRRQEPQPFSVERTFQPTRRLYLLRGCVEYFRVTGPAFCSTWVGLCMALAADRLYSAGLPALAALLPTSYFLAVLSAGLFVLAAKWALMGRYRTNTQPLWSGFCWRTELVTALYENAFVPLLLYPLLGTPFAAWALRGLGAKVGRAVYMDTTFLTEFDLAEIGSGAALNADCSVQTHLFEDRVMKMDHLKIGDNCSVGEKSVVLYSSEMEDGATLGPLSLLMKGERLPANSRWEGSPAQEATAMPSCTEASEAQRACAVTPGRSLVPDAAERDANASR